MATPIIAAKAPLVSLGSSPKQNAALIANMMGIVAKQGHNLAGARTKPLRQKRLFPGQLLHKRIHLAGAPG